MSSVAAPGTTGDMAAPAPQGARGEARGRVTAGNYKWWVLVTAIFGAFVSILDQTIVNTALPKMQAVFGADLHQISYVTTGYTLAAGVVVGASGYLANRFGIKRVYLGSLALFTLFSALCGLSWSTGVLILFRVLQGAGGAALFPLALSLIFGAFPPEERGLANGVGGIPILVAPAIGPTVGGYLVQYVDWRWIFYINVPIGILGVIIGWRVLRESPLQRGLPFDLRGFLFLAVGLGLLLYGTSNLAYDGWGSFLTVSGPIVVALLVLAIYVPVALRTRRPILDLRLFRSRNFWAGNLLIWLATIGLFGGQFLLPQFLQNLRGLDPYHSGLLLLPLGLAAMVATVATGAFYNRVDPRWIIAVGALVTAVGTYLLGQWSTLSSAYSVLVWLLILRGLGLPALAQTTNTVALQGIEGAALPGASTLSVVARNVVASLAVAVLVNLLQNQRITHGADLASQVTLSDPATAALYNNLAAVGGRAAALSQIAGQVTRQATALAFQDIYALTALITVPAIFMTLLLRPSKGGRAPGPPAE